MNADDQMKNDVSEIERAIVAAVAPPASAEIDGWIAAFDNGTVSRARSAAPLSHEHAGVHAIGKVRAAYFARGLAPMFRVPQLAMFAAAEDELQRCGMEAQQPTDVQVARASD